MCSKRKIFRMLVQTWHGASYSLTVNCIRALENNADYHGNCLYVGNFALKCCTRLEIGSRQPS
jgi:hypothetical protein